jgi:proteasome lid subunit RPN8/RPN11
MKYPIKVNHSVLDEMYKYAHAANELFNSEIAGWAHFNSEKGIYKLAPLSKQIVEGAEVNNFPDEIINNTEYDISDMIVQWHSHVNGNCNPSGINGDIGNINKALKMMPYLISIIVNCKNEYYARLDYAKVGNINVPASYTEIELIPYYSDMDKIKNKVKSKCTPKIYDYQKDNPFHHWQDNIDNFIPPDVKNPTLFDEEDKLSLLYEKLSDLDDKFICFEDAYQIVVRDENHIIKYDKINKTHNVDAIGFDNAESAVKYFIARHVNIKMTQEEIEELFNGEQNKNTD